MRLRSCGGAKVRCVIYALDENGWTILLPLSKPNSSGKCSRERGEVFGFGSQPSSGELLIARVNGLFGGKLEHRKASQFSTRSHPATRWGASCSRASFSILQRQYLCRLDLPRRQLPS